jgi:hypothetical protein
MTADWVRSLLRAPGDSMPGYQEMIHRKDAAKHLLKKNGMEAKTSV